MLYRRWYMNAAPIEGSSMNTDPRWTSEFRERGLPAVGGYIVTDPSGEARAQFTIGPDAERYVRDRNREDGTTAETGDTHGEPELTK
jgi:hypothetical protein